MRIKKHNTESYICLLDVDDIDISIEIINIVHYQQCRNGKIKQNYLKCITELKNIFQVWEVVCGLLSCYNGFYGKIIKQHND